VAGLSCTRKVFPLLLVRSTTALVKLAPVTVALVKVVPCSRGSGEIRALAGAGILAEIGAGEMTARQRGVREVGALGGRSH